MQKAGKGISPLDTGLLETPKWTDKSFPLGRDAQGRNLKPDFDFNELGLLFPQNDITEEIFILDQMEHTKKLGTALRLHVHFFQDSVNIPNFECKYRFYNNGDPIPNWTTIKTDDGAGAVFAYVGTPFVNLIQFPEIPAPANEKVSAILDLIIYRNDSNISGDVLAKYVDYHFQVGRAGSEGDLG